MVIVIDASVYAAVNTGINVEVFIHVLHQKNTGVSPGNSEVRDVAVQIWRSWKPVPRYLI